MKYLKIFLCIAFSFITLSSQAQDSTDVTFRYYPSDNAIRAFVPGEFNNWGNNTNGAISPTDGSLLEEDAENGFWYQTIRLEVGGGNASSNGASGYTYKFHEHLNQSGTENLWITDPLNPIAVGQNGDSFVEVTHPLIFQVQPGNNKVLDEQDEIWATVAGTTSDPIDLEASEISVNGDLFSNFLGYFDESRNLLFIADIADLNLSVGENTLTIRAVTEAGSEKTAENTFSYLGGVDPELAARPAGLEDGITYHENGTSVTLSLFAPNKDYVFAIGDFNNWIADENYLMKKDSLNTDSVWHWVEITGLEQGKEYGFQYLVDGELRISDPYSSLILDPFNDGYISETTFPDLMPYPHDKTDGWITVIQPGKSEYIWEATDYQRPEKEELVIYELLIRDFLEEKNFQTLTDSLDYLENLGVNAIELMPVNEFDGNLSWGYNPNHHLALDKAYGTPEAFKKFVDEAHKRDMAVILDVVLNHATDPNPLYQLYGNNDDYYFNSEPRHSYNVFNDMDHSYSATQYYSKRVIEHWIEEYKIDGFRWDLTKGFTQNCTAGDEGCTGSFQQDRVDILKQYADYQWAADPDFIVIFEHLGGEQEEAEWANYRVDEGKGVMLWGNMNNAYSEASMGYSSNLTGVLTESRSSFEERHLVGYMESHDEQWLMFKNLNYGNSSGSYDITELETALQRQKLAGAFFFTLPGPKMMWQFGELGYGGGPGECLKPSGDGSDGDCEPSDPIRVGEKPIRWDYYDDAERKKLYKAWSELITLRKSSPAFTDPEAFSHNLSGSVKTITLEHSDSDVVIVGNFGVETANQTVTFPSTGTWYNHFSGTSETISEAEQQVSLGPGVFEIFTTKEFATPEDDLVTSKEEGAGVPSSYKLGQNYPNPFNPTTNISYEIAEAGKVELEVFDMLGRKVAEVVNQRQASGSYTVNFDASRLSSGLYIYRLRANGKVMTKKMTLIK
ncbi:MAG: alpha-amylase family glycosyl hydrolase [Gracilimonas sp.]